MDIQLGPDTKIRVEGEKVEKGEKVEEEGVVEKVNGENVETSFP